ncbi:caspase domain-containing protein [Polychytrium aggregatum]|uniref:caspase domain-containing protein n=1 Tax=Polychytrium aggregatum TaxID=110093 RepID=UPI0022FEFBC6|nr:caspase domain-containing protein [Polychytrium aggregatum]KAI9202398.1 caspase domain-containing protein [Polychytrium aggregatum]
MLGETPKPGVTYRESLDRDLSFRSVCPTSRKGRWVCRNWSSFSFWLMSTTARGYGLEMERTGWPDDGGRSLAKANPGGSSAGCVIQCLWKLEGPCGAENAPIGSAPGAVRVALARAPVAKRRTASGLGLCSALCLRLRHIPRRIPSMNFNLVELEDHPVHGHKTQFSFTKETYTSTTKTKDGAVVHHYESHSSSTPAARSPRKKALLIGINYIGSKHELKGCINDIKNIQSWLLKRDPAYGEHLVVLRDDHENPVHHPTRNNIINAMRWLALDTAPGDRLFFHYSGHGSTAPSHDSLEDEPTGLDETMVPVDFTTNGFIIDDDIHDILCKPIASGVQLVAFVDCCHSGTIFDLPYTYRPDGSLDIVVKSNNSIIDALHPTGGFFKLLTEHFQSTDHQDMLEVLLHHGVSRDQIATPAPIPSRNKTCGAIFQFSGCKDVQTSADAKISGQARGALTYALLAVLAKKPHPTYTELLQDIRDILRPTFTQIPQLSTGYLTDVHSVRFEI